MWIRCYISSLRAENLPTFQIRILDTPVFAELRLTARIAHSIIAPVLLGFLPIFSFLYVRISRSSEANLLTRGRNRLPAQYLRNEHSRYQTKPIDDV
jgi:hypothetical protein